MTLLSRARAASGLVAAAGGLAVVLVVVGFLFPNDVPGGIFLDGVVAGCRSALIAAGLILVYRSARIINFAQVALGTIGAAVMFNLGAIGVDGLGKAPFLLAFLSGLAVCMLLGLFVELYFVRRFFSSPRLVLTVVTIVATPTLATLSGKISVLPFWPKGLDVVEARGLPYPAPYESFGFDVSPIRFGFVKLLTIVVTVVVFAALAVFFRRSRIGAAVRGTAENSDRAQLLGINVKLLSTVVWAMAALLSGLGAMLAMLDGSGAGAGSERDSIVSVLMPPLAAIVVARLSSLPATVVAAVALGILDRGFDWSYPGSVGFDVVLLVVVLVGLYLQRGSYSRNDGGLASSWQAVQELRPTPKELVAVPGIRLLRRGLYLAGAVFLVVFPLTTSVGSASIASLIAIQAIIALSLVVLTGWGGQVSLGQLALVAVGALTAGTLTAKWSVPFWIALPVAAVVTAGVAILVGQPAMRVRGPFLPVVTLAFALAVHRVVFTSSLADDLAPGSIERPTLLFVSFASERNYYYLCVAFTVLAAVVVRRLRAGRPGRVLIAIRDDEYGVAPFGISAARTRIAVFALAGALAGFAGTLLVHLDRDFVGDRFLAIKSVDAFVLVMIGGVSSVSGAILGAVYVGSTELLIADEQIRRLSNAGGLLFLLVLAPGGLSSVLFKGRDAILRIVAQRRRMVVPSLFEDYDAAALERRQTAFAAPVEGRGLSALPAGQRYAGESELYPSARRSADAPAGASA